MGPTVPRTTHSLYVSNHLRRKTVPVSLTRQSFILIRSDLRFLPTIDFTTVSVGLSRRTSSSKLVNWVEPWDGSPPRVVSPPRVYFLLYSFPTVSPVTVYFPDHRHRWIPTTLFLTTTRTGRTDTSSPA